MKKTTVYLDAGTERGLRGPARSSGTSQALIIRRAVSEYIAVRQKPRLERFIGCVNSGDPGLAHRAKRELRRQVQRGEWDDR